MEDRDSTSKAREISVNIGGAKGHVEECVTDENFCKLYQHFRWKMIPNCTGRYTCRDHKKVSMLPPMELLNAAGIVTVNNEENDTSLPFKLYYITFDHERRKDPIYVIPFSQDAKTGLISYTKSTTDETGECISYVHTLNSPSGFQRKLDAIQVVLSDEYIV